MTITKLFLAATAALMMATGDAMAADILLTKIRIADRDSATRVVLEFSGAAAPKGRVSVSGNQVTVEMDDVKRAKQVATAAAKSDLVADHALNESKSGTPVLVVTTRMPVKLVTAPVVLPADKSSGPRLYFDLERDKAAKPQAAGASPAPGPAPAENVVIPAELEAAAKAGNLEAQMQLASALGKQQKYAQSLQWYRAAAEQGNGPAAYNVAQYLRMGLGMPADPAAAFKWYERSAATGFARGQFATALMLINGEAGVEDTERAVFLLQQAAAAGLPQAQSMLQSLEKR